MPGLGGRILRRILMPVFARINPGDIHVTHHHTGERFRLHSFRHRGYWYHGKNREKETIDLFSRLIRPGDAVVEVGGHIGYLSVIFSKLVGKSGRVHVFEPGVNNLPYIKANLAASANAEVIEMACGAANGPVKFFLENLTGQNNSMLSDYRMFAGNAAASSFRQEYQEVTVECIRLDDYFAKAGIRPDFMKIDAEGVEYDVLRGMPDCLATVRPMIMTEVTSKKDDVVQLLVAAGYAFLDDKGTVCPEPEFVSEVNIFCVHPETYADRIAGLR